MIDEEYSIYTNPKLDKRNKPIGEYRIGDIDDDNFIAFSLRKKPHPFHRMMVRLFFGLRWIDYKKTK
jgi:hypothetical protein